VDAWVQRFLDRPGIEAVPLAHRAAARSYQLHHLEHRDPADRLLIATAIELRCPLVTYDERITQFGKKRGRQQGFSVEV
jgi:PIN domain nuclease of toxin-antitoxin system